jgi:hypothetical protein
MISDAIREANKVWEQIKENSREDETKKAMQEYYCRKVTEGG